jgi:hypothetical protein
MPSLGGETLGWTIIIIAIRIKEPPMRIRRVNGSNPSKTEKKAANTTSVVRITATLTAEILACDQVWTMNARKVANTAVKATTLHVWISGGGVKPDIEAGIPATIAQVKS